MLILLGAALLMVLLGSLPTWRTNGRWGHHPSGGVSLILFVLLALFVALRL